MWILLIAGIFAFLGLRSGANTRSTLVAVFVVTLAMLGYESLHLHAI